MPSEILFSEKQRFTQWWLWILLLGINGLLLAGLFYQIGTGRHFGSKPVSNTALLLVAGSTLLLTALFLSFRLETVLKTEGIYVRFVPLHSKAHFYPWNSLSHCYLRQYSPLKEYGGWGIRYSPFGKGTAFNISGNKGLQLETTAGKKILIGTRRSEQITAVLAQIGQPNKAGGV